MMRTRPDHRPVPHAFDDRGTALLETAVVAPVFLALVFGILEFGLLFKTYLTANDTVLDAARVGAVQGPNPTTDGANADFSIVKSVRDSTAGIDPQDIERIVVYRGRPSTAGSPMAQVPSVCKNGDASSVASSCNVYDPIEAFDAVQRGDTDYFDCSAGTEASCGWDPDSRSDGPRAVDIDYVGVYVEVKHDMITGLYGTERDIDAAAIQRIEPGVVE